MLPVGCNPGFKTTTFQAAVSVHLQAQLLLCLSYLKVILLFWLHGADIGVHVPSRCKITLVPFAHTATKWSVLVLWAQQVKSSTVGNGCLHTVVKACGQESRWWCCFCSSLCPLDGVISLACQVHSGPFSEWSVNPVLYSRVSVACPLWQPYLSGFPAVRKTTSVLIADKSG